MLNLLKIEVVNINVYLIFFFWPMIDTLLSRNFSEFDWPPGQVQFAQLAMHQRVNEIAFFSIIVVVK